MAVGLTLTIGSVTLGVGNLQASGWGLSTKVDYLAFDVYTFADVRSSEMERAAACSGQLPKKEAEELREIIARAEPGTFTDTCIRLKMVGPFGETVFVNQGGQVRAKRDGVLTRAALKRVAAILERNCPRSL